MSLFLDEKVLNYSEDITNRIIVGPVEGVLKEPLQISVEANWENIFNIGISPGIQKVFSLGGVGLLNAGFWTRKYYKGGSYLRITPKMRVVNWDGNNDVIRKAQQLTDLCLPLYKGKTFNQFFENLDITDLATDGLKKTAEIIANPKAETKKLIDQLSSNSPKPVMVSVSNFFRNYFIVESVNVEFSKEMTPQGPLYADIELVLSTPEVTIRGNTGLKQTGTKWKNVQ